MQTLKKMEPAISPETCGRSRKKTGSALTEPDGATAGPNKTVGTSQYENGNGQQGGKKSLVFQGLFFVV